MSKDKIVQCECCGFYGIDKYFCFKKERKRTKYACIDCSNQYYDISGGYDPNPIGIKFYENHEDIKKDFPDLEEIIDDDPMQNFFRK